MFYKPVVTLKRICKIYALRREREALLHFYLASRSSIRSASSCHRNTSGDGPV